MAMLLLAAGFLLPEDVGNTRAAALDLDGDLLLSPSLSSLPKTSSEIHFNMCSCSVWLVHECARARDNGKVDFAANKDDLFEIRFFTPVFYYIHTTVTYLSICGDNYLCFCVNHIINLTSSRRCETVHM